ncbi:divalent-cation tolerance protein CutA [Nesterenkonia massiliensis]|uniref:Divalent-cation tolerance protein CutA n=1 Tax=Nesterenkonia massiliensis TaxID=1232429 RepID=A0ABT2HPY0_9MICC|nr:divalent-cation tolerance protein CutA [Nesterenkonia massiliensis]
MQQTPAPGESSRIGASDAADSAAALAVIVQTTVGSETEASELAGRALEARLAACAQVSQIRSLYRWAGEIQDEAEQLVSFKTTRDAAVELCSLLEREHSYEEPEVVVLPIIDGSDGYLRWLEESTRPGTA